MTIPLLPELPSGMFLIKSARALVTADRTCLLLILEAVECSCFNWRCTSHISVLADTRYVISDVPLTIGDASDKCIIVS
jgi:hypothetical protein